MKNLTTSSSCFPKLIEGNYLYVDKTEYLWKLVAGSMGQYFLSRPRRFGKSLTLSTLEAIFQGRKELFQGLAIYDKPYSWEKYPVIHLNFGNCYVQSSEELDLFLTNQLENLARDNELALRGDGATLQFENCIRDLFVKGPVVILIDEYDKPILDNIQQPYVQDILRTLKSFYSVVKVCEQLTRFAFITGVSKFSHVSLFSDLNNLTDLTMNAEFAGMLGFTEEEIRSNFADRLPQCASALECTIDELLEKVRFWYDGYRFSKSDVHVCNPVSVTKFFYEHGEFRNFWCDTGTPTFLLQLMKKTSFDFEKALGMPVEETVFKSYELGSLDPMGLLWQTGYLTIKQVNTRRLGTARYLLGFPDFEVEQTFNTQLHACYTGMPSEKVGTYIDQLLDAIEASKLEQFMKLLCVHFANIPYDIHVTDEKYYQSLFYQLFLLMGLYIDVESRTNDGRIDAYIRTDTTVYIFEFKLNKTVDMALAQIVNKEYFLKFQACGLPIRLIGVNFDASTGQIGKWGETVLQE